MSQEQTIRIAQQLLADIGAGVDPNEIAALFSADVQFEVPGDIGALPWIGRRTGCTAFRTLFVARVRCLSAFAST
jgi:hypothetical protein